MFSASQYGATTVVRPRAPINYFILPSAILHVVGLACLWALWYYLRWAIFGFYCLFIFNSIFDRLIWIWSIFQIVLLFLNLASSICSKPIWTVSLFAEGYISRIVGYLTAFQLFILRVFDNYLVILRSDTICKRKITESNMRIFGIFVIHHLVEVIHRLWSNHITWTSIDLILSLKQLPFISRSYKIPIAHNEKILKIKKRLFQFASSRN